MVLAGHKKLVIFFEAKYKKLGKYPHFPESRTVEQGEQENVTLVGDNLLGS